MNGKHKLESDAEDVDIKKGKIDNIHSGDFQDKTPDGKASPCNLKVYPKRNRTPSAKAFDCLVESTNKQKNSKSSKKSNTSPTKTPSKLYVTDASSKQIISSEKTTNDGQIGSSEKTVNGGGSIENNQSTSVTSDLTSSSANNDVGRSLINANGKLPLLVLQNIEIQQDQIGAKKEKVSEVKVVENSSDLNPLDNPEKNISDVENVESVGRLPALNAGGKTNVQMKSKTKYAERCQLENLPLLESTKKTELQLMQNKTCESILMTHMRDVNDISNLGSKNLPMLDSANDRFIQNSSEKLPSLIIDEDMKVLMKPIEDSKNVRIVQLDLVTSEKLPLLDSTENDANKLKLSTGSDDLLVDKKEKAGHTNFFVSVEESSLQESGAGTHSRLNTPSEKLPPLPGTVKDDEKPSTIHTGNTEINKNDLKSIRSTENLSTSSHSENTDELNISKLHSNGITVKELPSLNHNIFIVEEQLDLQNDLKVLPTLDCKKDLVKNEIDFTDIENVTSSDSKNIIDDEQLNSDIINPSRELRDFVADEASVVVSCSTTEDVPCGSSESIENEPTLDSKFKTATAPPITGAELSKSQVQTVSSTTSTEAISDKISVTLDAVTESLPELDFNLITDGLPLMNASDSLECLQSVEN